MPQKFGLYEDLTVLENLNLYADLRGVTGTERRRKFDRLLEFTALKDFQKRLAGALSGGMKQKLGLACALIGDPQLLLLDEPSVGVDPISRRELWSMVRELAGSGMAVLWSTAYLDEAQKCDTVILLNAGKKLHDGPPSELLQRVQGRTFLIDGVPAERRRALLMRTLSQPEVIDGVIQGSQIRIVRAPDTASKPTLNEAKAQWRQVKPWFEDGFVDILGGGPGGRSVLAERMTDKPRKDAPLIEAMELTKRFGDFTAVQDNSFRIYRGEIFGLLGPNGAGKSTTFKMMCGLLQPTSGEAYVDGLSLVRAGSQARARIGYMAQKFSLYGNLSVRENLRFFAGLYEVPDDKPKQMVEIFELDRYATQTAGQLPLGIKQRLALACAVMHEPEVLFLDEPTSGVDPITRREFWTHINGMVTRGVTVMVTTHFMDESEYCDRIGLIYRGRNIATGTPDDLKEQVRSHQLPNPTLEEAFIELVQSADQRAEEVA
jgi:ABC-2 type transport system ATP-binding protein